MIIYLFTIALWVGLLPKEAISFQTNSYCGLLRLVSMPTFLGSKDALFRSTVPQVPTQTFTLSFWFRKMETTNSRASVLSLQNARAPSFESPECSVDPERLRGSPELASRPENAGNPNCALPGLKFFELEYQADQNSKFWFRFPFQNDGLGPLTEELEIQGLGSKDWLFVTVGFDFEGSGLKIFVKHFAQPSVRFQKNVSIFPNPAFLQPGFYTRVGDLSYGSGNFAVLHDLNVMMGVWAIPENLSLFNVGFGTENSHVRVNAPLGQSSTEWLELKLENFPRDTLVKSPSFHFGLEVFGPFARRSLLALENTNGRIEVFIAFDANRGLSVTIEFVSSSNRFAHSFDSLTTGGLFEASLSLVQFNDQLMTFYLFTPTRVFVSDDFTAPLAFVPQPAVRISKLAEKEVRLFRFLAFDSAMSFVFSADSFSIDHGCLGSCGVRLFPGKCLTCAVGVLSPELRCEDYCPQRTQNKNGVCLPCNGLCDPTKQATILLERTSNSNFLIRLSPNLKTLYETNRIPGFNAEIYGKRLEKEEYSVTKASNNTYLLAINRNASIYDTSLEVSADLNHTEIYFDDNRNLVTELSTSYYVETIRFLSDSHFKVVQVLAYVFIGLSLAILLIGIGALFYSVKFTEEVVLGKLVILSFHFAQAVAFVLLIRAPLPGNFNQFLRIVYQYFVGFNSLIFRGGEHLDHSHPNLTDVPIFKAFLHNYQLAPIVQLAILLLFIFSLFLTTLTCFSPIRKHKLRNFAQIFQFNFIIITFIILDQQVFHFLSIEFLNSTRNVLSIVLASIYVAILFLGSFMLIGVHLKKKGYVNSFSKIKFQMFYLLVGYVNRYCSNAFELFRIFRTAFLAFLLVLFINSPVSQVMLGLCTMIVFLIITVLINPWDNSCFGIFEVYNQMGQALLWILAGAGGFGWNYRTEIEQTREVAGWVSIAIILSITLANFLLCFSELIRLIKSISFAPSTIDLKTDGLEDAAPYIEASVCLDRRVNPAQREFDDAPKGNSYQTPSPRSHDPNQQIQSDHSQNSQDRYNSKRAS